MTPTSLKCFTGAISPQDIDRVPFTFGHSLVGHEALSLGNLARVVVDLPKDQVFFSSGLVPRDADFDRAHVDHATGLSLTETIEQIRVSNSYIMVRAPETHASFRPLFRQLLGDVESLMKAKGVGIQASGAMLYLFIASPNSITPFHIDRYSTFLLQFQGRKDLYVYPPWDERLVSAESAESFVVKHSGRPIYDRACDHLAKKFSFSPGEALHIPFLAPHHVHNGDDEVSISLSIIFNTDETMAQIRALHMNQLLRKGLGKVGLRPEPVGCRPRADRAKAAAYKVLSRLRRRELVF